MGKQFDLEFENMTICWSCIDEVLVINDLNELTEFWLREKRALNESVCPLGQL